MSSPADHELPNNATADALFPHESSEYITPVVHYYRGELSRMITWRDRLDHTTNWAIAASAAMLSVTLSSPDSHHAVILCCMALVFLLLRIEARRYRFFDVSRRRARLLERNYFARIFGHEEDDPDWRERLVADLRRPEFQLSLNQAMRNRLRRNYLWIYLTLLVSWWLKVTTVILEARTGRARFVSTLDELLENAAVSYVPGAAVIAGVIGFLVWLLVLVLSNSDRLINLETEADV